MVKRFRIDLTDDERAQLEALTTRGKTAARKIRRAQIEQRLGRERSRRTRAMLLLLSRPVVKWLLRTFGGSRHQASDLQRLEPPKVRKSR